MINIKNKIDIESKVDIENILEKALDNDKNNNILELNTFKINKIKLKVFKYLKLNDNDIEIYSDKLKDYIYISEIDKLTLKSFYRWFYNNKLTHGGFLLDIKINDNGILLLMYVNNRYFNIKYDNIILFKKLNDEEKLLLLAIDYIL